MKLSRYNIEKKEDKSCLIYNTVTSAILELDTDYEKSYYKNFTNINAIETYLKPHLDSMQVNHIEKIFRFITAELYLRDVNAKTK